MFKKFILRIICICLIFACLMVSAALAQTTIFTYQGKLTDSGAAQSSYQMEFKLFGSLSGADQIGGAITNPNVTVNQGVFTVNLDFGASVFSGADRFLQISVRRNTSDSFVTLNPRQQITSSPYSIRTLSAAQADLALDSNKLGGVDASQYVTTSTVGNSFIKNSTAQQTGANFNIDGSGAANVFNAQTQYNIGGSRVLGISAAAENTYAGIGAGNVNTGGNNSFFGSQAGVSNTTGGNNSFIGTRAGFLNSTGDSDSFVGTFAGYHNTTGVSNSFFGRSAGESNTTGNSNSFVGNNAGFGNLTGSGNTIIGNSADVGANNLTNATAIGAGAVVSQSNSLILGSGAKVGIGTSIPQAKFHVIGTSWFQGDTTPLPNTAGKGIAVGFGGETGYLFAFDYTAFAPKNLLLNSPGGNVGIGTATPRATLDVAGNAVQNISANGLVKAMIYVDSFLPASQYIVRCYNSVTNSSTGNCGFTVTRTDVGQYEINFGFQVNNRFLSVTQNYYGLTVGAAFDGANTAYVATYDPYRDQLQDSRFYIIIY